ncbi:TPA_asm: hypothetical protein [Altiarchaeum virus]|nr:TPA_asm: hypothetical protein [Altiarchaeum virus]
MTLENEINSSICQYKEDIKDLESYIKDGIPKLINEKKEKLKNCKDIEEIKEIELFLKDGIPQSIKETKKHIETLRNEIKNLLQII